MITDADMPEGYRLVTATGELLLIEDAGQPDLFLNAELDKDGDAVFSVRAEGRESGRRGIVSGSVPFDLMFRHYGGDVRSITSWWSDETNLRIYQTLLGEGATIHEAASNTWTALQAQQRGFLAVLVTPLTASSPDGGARVQFIRTGVGE